MRNILLAVTAAAGLVGCVGGIDMPSTPAPVAKDPPPGTVGEVPKSPAAAEARTLFETTVFSIAQAKCTNGVCHSTTTQGGTLTKFVATTQADAYVTAVSFQALVGDWTPTGAPILLKVAAGHNGAVYTIDEKAAITAWLNKELEARAGGTPPPPGVETPGAATVRLTKEWSGCMTLANFTTANMVAWGNMRADNSACKTCHINGEYGQIASDLANQAPAPFFGTISTNKYYMAQYFSVQLNDPATPTAPFDPAKAKIIINTKSFTGVGTATPPHTEHPRFNLTGSTGLAALQKFYDLTVKAKAIPAGQPGACGPPTLKN